MKVICDRGALAEAIGLVSSVVAARTPRPQLRCVKLTAETIGKSGRLTLAATDAEISLELRLEMVAVERDGAALVPADKLARSSAPRTPTPRSHSKPTATSPTSAAPTPTSSSAASPPTTSRASPAPTTPPRPPAGPPSPTTPATSTNSSARPSSPPPARTPATPSTASSCNRDGKTLECVATDGRRLALAKASLDDAERRARLGDRPAKALNMIQRLIDDADEPVSVSVSDNRVVFALGLAAGGPAEDCRAVLAANLVEGTFPPYEDVIPKDQDIKVGFDRDVLASAVRRAALLTNEESRGVRMAFSGGDKKLELSSRVPEMGEARIGVDLASFDGTDIEIGFNPAFITDALKVVDQPDVLLELKAPNKPGLFKAGPGFTYVVMPVNLQ
jgi:DNA polymerase-3 subunit beta